MSGRAKTGFDIGPATGQISIDEEDVAVNYVIQLRSGVTSTSPTNVFDESVPRAIDGNLPDRQPHICWFGCRLRREYGGTNGIAANGENRWHSRRGSTALF